MTQGLNLPRDEQSPEPPLLCQQPRAELLRRHSPDEAGHGHAARPALLLAEHGQGDSVGIRNPSAIIHGVAIAVPIAHHHRHAGRHPRQALDQGLFGISTSERKMSAAAQQQRTTSGFFHRGSGQGTVGAYFRAASSITGCSRCHHRGTTPP